MQCHLRSARWPGALLLSAVVLSALAEAAAAGTAAEPGYSTWERPVGAPASGANASENAMNASGPAILSCGTGSDCATGAVNSSSANGTNTSPSAAPCGAGSTTGPAGACVPCDAGLYKDLPGTGQCYQCPAGSSSRTGSFDQANCTCLPGHTGPAGGPCVPCAAGEYKSTNGSAACSLCAGGTFSGAIAGDSDTVCVSCPNHSSSPRGSSHVSNCTCEAGYAGPGGGACAQCPAGTYKRSDGSGPCANCARGKYSSSLAQTACTACPADQTFSPEGSADVAACQCQPGSWRHTRDWTPRGLAGFHENAGYTDGIGSHARFEAPSGVAFNPAGTQVAVSVGKRISGESCGIRLVDVSSRGTSTIVISPPGFQDGTGSNARFGLPSGLAFSPDGKRLVVADERNNAIRIVEISERVVTTLAGGGGGTGQAGFADGTRALFYSPVGVVWTTGGHVIVSEVGAHKIRIIDVITGVTNTLAGAAMPGSQDGRGQQAHFNQPRLLTLIRDESSVLVADSGNGQVRQVSIPHGDTTTLRNSEGESNLFNNPYGVSVSPDGRLLAVSEYGGASVEVMDLETGTHDQVLLIRNYFSSQRPGSVYGIAWSPRGPELVITTIQVETLHVLTGPGCEMCWAGSFFINKTGTELAETNNYKASMCGWCPLHTWSPIGSTSIYDCRCQKGYTGPDGEACQSCQPGTYKSTVGSASCFRCSNHSWSSNSASTSIASCICNAGFVASDQGVCSACPAGTYQHVNSSGCIPCSRGKYSTALAAISESTCMACPPHSSSTFATGSPTGCTCEAGFEGPDQGFLGVENESCVACAPGTFKLDNSSSACASCAPGTFKENSGSGTCELCPANSSSDSAGSMSMSACRCNAGYSGMAPSCLACEAGYYKQSSGSSDCVSCQEGAHTSDVAAVSGAACKCGAGRYRLAGGLESGYVRTVGLELGAGVWLRMYSGFAVMPDGLSVVALTNTGCIVSILLASSVARGLICLPGSDFYGSAVAAIPPDGSSFVVGHQMESLVYIINASLHMRIIGATYALPSQEARICRASPGLTDSDGSATEARFNKPTDLTVTADGSTVFVADRCNAAIRRIDVKTGQVDTVVRTVRDRQTNQVLASGPGYAPFWMPQNIGLAPNGTILIVVDDVGAVYKVELRTRDTTFIAGSTSWYPAFGYGGYQDGFGTAARFFAPAGVAISPDGETAYIADSYNHRIRNLNIASGQVGTFVGSGASGGKFGGIKDGSPTTAEFNDIMRIAFVPDGSALLVAQYPLVQYPTIGGHHWVNFLSVVGVRATGQCAACPAGTFSTSGGTGTQCSVCPQNSRSLPYSTRLGDCVCDRGYTGPDGGICSPCAAGKFKDLIGNHSCLPCSAHADSQTGASKCYCIMGHYEANAGVCTPCGAGSYNDINGSVVCERCSAGKYSNATAATECLACPLHSVSGQGSSYISNCTCSEGYSGSDGGECEACAAGTYKDVNGSDQCTLCAPGTYFAGVAATGCLACPSHSFSGQGSSNISNCICNEGYSGPDEYGGPCSEFSRGGGTSTSMSSSSTAVASSTTADSSSTPLRTSSTTPHPRELSSSTTTLTTSASATSSSSTTSKLEESSSTPAPTSSTTSHPVAGSSSTASATTLASTTSSSSTPSPSTSTPVPTSSSTVTATTSSSAAELSAFFSTTPAPTFTSPTHTFSTPTPAQRGDTVSIVFALALSLEAFTLDKQIAFKNALAIAANLSPADVAIEKIEASQSSRRSLLAEGIRVEVSIKVTGAEAFGNDPASTLKLDKFNTELIDLGLPAATVIVEYGNVTPSTTADSSSTPLRTSSTTPHPREVPSSTTTVTTSASATSSSSTTSKLEESSSTPAPTSSTTSHPVAGSSSTASATTLASLIAGLLVGAGLVLGLGLAGFFVVRWKWKKTLPKSDETQAPVVGQSRSLRFEDGVSSVAYNSEDDGASSHESDESDRICSARQGNTRHNRAENESFESLFMDVEGVQKRREHLRATMQQARTTRKEQVDAVSSSDEEKKSGDVASDERDMHRIDAHIQGLYTSRVFSGEAGEKELLAVKATTRKMRQFWERLAMGLSPRVFSSKVGEKDQKKVGATTRKMRRFLKRLTKSLQHHSHSPNAPDEVNIDVKVELQNGALQADFVTADAGGVLHHVDISIANGNVHQGLYSWYTRVDLGQDQTIPNDSSGSGSLQQGRPLQTAPTLIDHVLTKLESPRHHV